MFDAYSRYFDFNGRSSRREFWLAILLTTILVFVATIIDFAAFDGAINLELNGYSGPAYIFLTLFNAIPMLAVQVRRMHDSDRSGWLLLIPLANIYWLGVQRGTPGPNRYGEPRFDQVSPIVVTLAPPKSPDATPGAMLERLERLGRLREQGLLTPEEFQQQKKLILRSDD